ncbi:interferon-induced very large GTPase 1-like [Lytechinus variegatus]|uniref:interferon-induced very large GTPase 1-like n=1 Tax=Lytechinus variegatus TaxID=7654 RepID=UPI001BB0F58D|nr:interferon-induced very large GTPase 1-like [Lytechinus variegatus]
MIRDALSAYASASYSGLILSVGGSVTGDRLKAHGSFTHNYQKSEQAKTILHTIRTGGPQEVSALPLWKMGLLTCNSTWALIDRGKSLSTDFVGIWTLIPNHQGDFQKPDEIESSLITVWERMSGYLESRDQERRVIKGLDALDLLIEKIGTWNSHPIPPEKCIKYLQEILKTVQQVETHTGSNNYWELKVCTEVNISSFLGNVVELRDRFSPTDASMIRYLLRKLVNPVGFREFPSKQNIMKWVEMTVETVQVPAIMAKASIKNIPEFMSNLKEIFIPTLLKEHVSNAEGNVLVSDSIDTAATADLAICVDNLIKDLKSSEELHEMFFLQVALLSIHYHWSKMKFDMLLTMKNLQDFAQSIQMCWKEFEEKKKKGMIQLEAFLIHKTLISDRFHEGRETSEDEFSDMIKDIRQVLSPQVNSVLSRYAIISPFNWAEMTSVTAELAKGNMSVSEESEVNIADLECIASSTDRKTRQEKTVKKISFGGAVQGDFLDILKTLGLEKWYPSKISFGDAVVIKKEYEHNRLVDLPWLFIHKLLMIDFHARDKLLSEVNNSLGEETPDEEVDFDLETALEMQTSSVDEEQAKNINTLDALVTIFTCCDNFLKQTLAQKLFVCKLAIPFMYPLGSGDKVGMSLWALRTIIVQHKEASQMSVTEKDFPVATFVRLGRPPVSKSKLVNDILSDDSHDTFVHRDCNNGTISRRISDGLVQCSWFITSGKENQHLPCTTMFLNLRGDASSMKKQMQILLEISSVVFVVVSAQDLARTKNSKTCQHILQSCGKCIVFLTSENKQELHICLEAVGKDILKGVPIILSSSLKGIKKNASEIKTKARGMLSDAITRCSGIVIEDFAQRAKELGITVDEYNDEDCIDGKVLAEKVVSHMAGKQIFECKDSLLPLQGAEWIGYCKLQKRQHRTSGKGSESSSAYHANQLKQQMNDLRKKQVLICNSLTPFINDFIKTLQKNSYLVMYSLKWMNLLLDGKSRTNLPALRREYNKVWTKFQKAKNNPQITNVEDLKSEVDEAENRLARASLGLENLFRELGQIYEAVEGSGKIGKTTKEGLGYLPEKAADLLLKGIPLELVDGDASSVPIAWVSAVLTKLGNMIGEKKLFVLSVLGIQSSGKSTLLNTMFGLQFAVSAGRCTRGAYMQLIPVDDNAGLPFNYVVVVDTEGLRAPELGQLKYEHDNELATLAIGLGDVTMINIKGENTAEMKDILQIAVHAFLRMNIVGKHIKDHRTCIFVHQNVSAADAEELMMHGSQKLQENLDDMAKEAAISENIANIHSFSQVIDFDVNKHVWYFSDLWHGNPPMAPSNPDYSKTVGEVRLQLLWEIAKRKTTFLTASNLSIRLSDLWNGVLADDFVFSFRNSLEVKAYNSLQSKYYTLELELQSKIKSWSRTAENKLKTRETVGELDTCFKSLTIELNDVLTEKAAEIKTCLTDYFENCGMKEIIIQWEQSKLNQLNLTVEQQHNECKTDLFSIKEARLVEIEQVHKWAEHELSIMNKAIEMAYKFKGKKVSDAELLRNFDIMWMSMVKEFSTQATDKELRMDLVMEGILWERLGANGTFLKKELQLQPLESPLEHTSLESSITGDFVTKKHISLKKHLLARAYDTLVGDKSPEFDARHKTMVLTSSILKEINGDLKGLTKHEVKFQTSHAKEVIHKLVEKIESHNKKAQTSEDCHFTILTNYVVKLAVHVSRHCVQVFTLMQIDYNNKHGVEAKLKNFRNAAWSLFKNEVKHSTEEVSAGDLLCTHLARIIHMEVRKETPGTCRDEVLRDFQLSKYYLMVKMMDDLAKKGNFKNFKSYITDAKEFALDWITKYTNEKMFSITDSIGMSRYAQITKSHVDRIIRCIAESVHHATAEVERKSGADMVLWIHTFCQRVSEEIAVPVSSLNLVTAREVRNFNNFQGIILDQLNEIQSDLDKHFVLTTEHSVNWDGIPPSERILEKIWGCPEQCPFCNEPCADITPGHYELSGRSHMCVQHRPGGVAGLRWKGREHESARENELIIEGCNYFVQWQGMDFLCGACKYRCRHYGKCKTTESNKVYHSYKEYKTYLQDWDIAPDPTNSVSKYWMRFMAMYEYQLKDMYSAKLPDIPEPWSLDGTPEWITSTQRLRIIAMTQWDLQQHTNSVTRIVPLRGIENVLSPSSGSAVTVRSNDAVSSYKQLNLRCIDIAETGKT